MSSCSGEESDQDDGGRSEVSFSVDLGSSALTPGDGELNVGDISTRGGITPAVVVSQSGKEEVAVALPPTDAEDAGEFHEIVLTGSAALDLLDQLAANNAIGKEKAAKLRRKYNTLRDTLESSRLTESNLLDKMKMLSHQLAYQRRVLEKGASFPEGATTHSGHLRQMLLSHQNELDMAALRLRKQEEEIERLKEDQAAVKKEYQRIPKKEELDQHLRELNKSLDELNDEISLRSQDVERHQADLAKKNFRITVINQETEELHQMQDTLQQELIELRAGYNTTKDIEIMKRNHREMAEESKTTDAKVKEMKSQMAEVEARNEQMNTECRELAAKLQHQRSQAMEGEIEFNQVSKHIMECKDREANLLEDKATLDIRLRHRATELKSLGEKDLARTREKDRAVRALKKSELQLSTLKQSTEQVKRQVSQLQDIKDKMLSDAEKLASSKQAMRREVDEHRRELQLMEGVSQSDQVKLNQKLALEEASKKCAKQLRNEVHQLNKDIIGMTKQRDNESRLYYQALKEHRIIVGDLQTKDAYIRDQQKKIRELEAELVDFVQAYDVVKGERNKTHSTILIMKQVSAELTEKAKIVANEIEILKSVVQEKESILQRCSTVYTSRISERDALYQDKLKIRQEQDEVRDDLSFGREAIIKLTRLIKATEKQLHKLRRRYEMTVQERNDLGLQLIERNEEVCVFYEKLNLQESIIKKANLKLVTRDEELRFLKNEVTRLHNQVIQLRNKLPERVVLRRELQNAQLELKQQEAELYQLERAVEDAGDENRLRILSGANPTRNQLSSKLDKVEGQLMECEQELLEKELLHEQVGKLTERAEKKVEGQRASTLAVAKKVNYYQAKIKEVTRKMMALVSELSMQQALSLRLEQESKELEAGLQQAYTRMENGEPPDGQAEVAWEKILRDEKRRRQAAIDKIALETEEGAQTLPNGVITSAEPRPNAYMPSAEGELPVPKPYGRHAPFRPSLSVGNLRHFRKPQPQPIDI